VTTLKATPVNWRSRLRTSGTPGVLHITEPTDGGVARYVTDVAAGQLQAGWRVVVACPAPGRLSGDLSAAGVEVLPWRAARQPGTTLGAEVRDLAALVESVDPALVHLHSSKAGLAGRLAIRGRRVTVFQPHAWSVNAVPSMLHGTAAAWERLAARWTDLVLCGSQDECNVGHSLGVHGRYAVVLNGVDIDRFYPANTVDREEARLRLGIDNGPLAVCVGRVCRQKGQDLLLHAWRRIMSMVSDATLVLVGGGSGAHITAPVGGVVVAGPVEDPSDWYAAADVVVCPSRWEGMALVPLEAMARARSVVASDVGGTREALPAGAGALVASGDAAALAAAIVDRLADQPRADREGQVGRAHVVRHHPLPRTLAGVDAAYRAALITRRTVQGAVA
jgi:glycosyltransferase involved in cell wall biosynthesis